jgi:glycosyltransferase involved in cell wall biosynthesis
VIPPRISIIVPLFNSEPFIAEALESLRMQSLTDWECIVVNDGSTDGGPAIADGLAARDARIRVVHQANRGLSASRNTGIECSAAPWLHFLDADDWMLPEGLAVLFAAGASSRNGLVCAAAEWFAENGAPLGFMFGPSGVSLSSEHLIESNRFQAHAALVSRRTLGSARFDAALPALEDWDLWHRLSASGERWRVVHRAVAAYRLRADSMSRDPRRMLSASDRVIGSIEASCRNLPKQQHAEAIDRLRAARARAALESLLLPRRLDDSDACAATAERLRALALAPPRLHAVIAQALFWRMPFVRCLPPTAWSDERYASDLAEDARTFLAALRTNSIIPVGAHRSIVRHLASLTVDPRDVARRIVERIPGVQTVVLHGLGRNAATLAPALVSAGHRVFGRDDAATPGESVLFGGEDLHVRVLAPDALPPHCWHVITPLYAPALSATVPEDEWRIEWSEVLSECAGRAEARLSALTLPAGAPARVAA